MRDSKFRIWDNKKGEMLYEGINYEDCYEGFAITIQGDLFKIIDFGREKEIKEMSEKRYKKMDYTGLEDKNGREIYEGDIVKKIYRDIARKGIVEYLNASFCLSLKLRKNAINNLKIIIHPDNDLEIIGNKYENPELINNES